MKYRVKGYAANPLVIGAVCLVVGVAIGVGGTLYFMSQHQGGLGDAEDAGLPEDAVSVSDTVSNEETVETEPPSTAPVTENLSYIKVVVSGSDYIYKGEPYSLDGIMAIIHNNPDLPVRVGNDGASKDAYEALIAALDDAGAEYVKANT